MKKLWMGIVCSSIILMLSFILKEEHYTLDHNLSVREALESLGEYEETNHEIDSSIEGASVKRGEEIVTQGYTRNIKGRKTRRISKHFVCTSCHNIQREDPDLSVIDPQARLEFTNAVGLPFLQGSPLYGIVNRDSFYNNDYKNKYGDLVDAARDDLREAIQLCSTECSQGRAMKDWELESVLMYFWTIDLKLNDLNIDKKEEELIAKALKNDSENTEAGDLIKSKFLVQSPSHFIPPPVDRIERKLSKGDPKNGELIYNNGCMHCHDNRRYSFYNLDHSTATFRNLRNNLTDYHERSIYQVARFGTSPAAGKKAYMPQYTKEKMSVQQLEDLKSYIIQEAK